MVFVVVGDFDYRQAGNDVNNEEEPGTLGRGEVALLSAAEQPSGCPEDTRLYRPPR